jgi:O-methyltransferase
LKKLDAIRKAKSLFMKWNLHRAVQPFSSSLGNAVNMGHMSQWRKHHPVKGYNDFYQSTWDYTRRVFLYEAILNQEGFTEHPLDYFEFGVAGGFSFKWWLDKNRKPESRFFCLDTFERFPEKLGAF